MSSGSGPMSSSLSSVAARSGESCRFAGASTRPSGMPFPSTMSDRFMPSLPRSTGLLPAHSPPPGGLGDAPADRELLQDQALTEAFNGAPGPPGTVIAVACIDDAETVIQVNPGDTPADGRFEVGSVTKTMTATLLALLAADGSLRLDDEAGRWLPA